MKSVLVVVEDDPDMQMLIEITLRADGRLELEGQAPDADAAVQLAQGLQPDLVILDHFIEGKIMGLQAAPLIKRVAPKSKVLLFTSHDLHVEAKREPAVDEYLRKHDISLLLPTVQRMLGLEQQPVPA